eukprot:PhF_6_TR22299/c0_g1_i1/m.31554
MKSTMSEAKLRSWESRLQQWEKDLERRSAAHAHTHHGLVTTTSSASTSSQSKNSYGHVLSLSSVGGDGDHCGDGEMMDVHEYDAAIPSSPKPKNSDNNHRLIKPLVFGGLDGLTTTLALVWSAIGAGESTVSSAAVIILGVANLLATGMSMGLGDFIGTLAEHDALQLTADHKMALRSGTTMFLSFIVCGGIPLMAYVPFGERSLATRRIMTTMMCIVSLFLLGIVRAKWTNTPMLRTGVLMTVVGSVASAI